MFLGISFFDKTNIHDLYFYIMKGAKSKSGKKTVDNTSASIPIVPKRKGV